jgi:hypothetical protein
MMWHPYRTLVLYIFVRCFKGGSTTGSRGVYHFYSNHMKFSTKIFLAWKFSYMQWTLTCGIWKSRTRWTLYLWQHKNVSGITILCLNHLGPCNKTCPSHCTNAIFKKIVSHMCTKPIASISQASKCYDNSPTWKSFYISKIISTN